MPMSPEKTLHSSWLEHQQLAFLCEYGILQLQELLYCPTLCRFPLNLCSFVSSKDSEFSLEQIPGGSFCVAFVSPGL